MKHFLQISIVCFIFSFQPAKAQLFNEEGLKFMKLFDWIKSRYVDSVNVSKFGDEIIRESMHKLDPHSVYLTRDEVKEMNEGLEGNFEGIGINFNILNDTIFIISVMPGGPSEKAGIKAGDRIIMVAGENVAGVGITSRQVTSKLKGEKGSVVNVLVKRRGEKKLISFDITRDRIPIYSIDAAYDVNSSIGYVKLSRFSHTTINELTKALTRFKKDKISNLILDLSGNGGGFFDVAISIADEFLSSDKLIVYTQGVHSPKKEYFSTSKGLFENGKLVLIIDEGSASASEILAGAVQDWDRGLIVGRRSYGKGLVQSQFIFPDESVIRLTTARYYTPTGRLIQKSYSNGYSDYSKEVARRFKNGELLNKDSVHLPDTLKFYTLTKKRTVFGGGGIMPDIFVPIDTTDYSDYYRKLLSNNILSGFIIQFIDQNRNTLMDKYTDFKIFKNKFEADEALLKEIATYAQEKSVAFDSTGFNQCRNLMSCYVKATIARNLWGLNEFVEVINSINPSFNKAVEAIDNWDKYCPSN